MPEKITVETKIVAPLSKVWDFYTMSEHITEWNAASDDWHTTKAYVDLRIGGQFSSRMEAKDGSFGFDFAGTYTNIAPHKQIEFIFWDRTCMVEFTEEAGAVIVRVTFDPETENPIEMQRDGWQAILNNFKKYVEGKPL